MRVTILKHVYSIWNSTQFCIHQSYTIEAVPGSSTFILVSDYYQGRDIIYEKLMITVKISPPRKNVCNLFLYILNLLHNEEKYEFLKKNPFDTIHQLDLHVGIFAQG